MEAIKKDNKASHTSDVSNSFSLMNIEREIEVRDAIKYCIENFDSQTATNRIVEFWKDELKLQEQQFNIANVVG